MKVKRFSAKKVYGYLDFDIRFNDDVSFLVGGNGSGKTTALRLMNALVMPNFKELLHIPFEFASIELVETGVDIEIFSVSNGDEKILKVSSVESEIRFPESSIVELEYFSHNIEKREDLVSSLGRKYASHEVVKKISDIKTPVFLGLERRHEGGDEKGDYYLEREMWLRRSNKRAIAAKRMIKGALGEGLMETEFLVQNSFRRLREIEERQSNKLRDRILLSAFQYSQFDVDELKPDMSSWREKSGLLQRQKEIKDALSKIGVKDNRLNSEVDRFFSQITELFETLSEDNDGINIEWLLNKAQVDRMSKIVEIIDEHRSMVYELFKPINLFLTTMNSFYSDSGKTLDIDTVGHLVVKRPDGEKVTIEGLSSGERQLLIIFAHAFFNSHRKNKTVFIIDEPELSLHLRWQEKFAETILDVSPESQFILATHSPEIVGINKKKAVGCR